MSIIPHLPVLILINGIAVFIEFILFLYNSHICKSKKIKLFTCFFELVCSSISLIIFWLYFWGAGYTIFFFILEIIVCARNFISFEFARMQYTISKLEEEQAKRDAQK